MKSDFSLKIGVGHFKLWALLGNNTVISHLFLVLSSAMVSSSRVSPPGPRRCDPGVSLQEEEGSLSPPGVPSEPWETGRPASPGTSGLLAPTLSPLEWGSSSPRWVVLET